MREALIFGGTGQIGRPLLGLLRRDGWRIRALSRQLQADEPGLHWLRGDLSTLPALPTRVDLICSCGPLDAFGRWYATAAIKTERVIAFGSTSIDTKQGSGDTRERDLAQRLREGEAAVFTHALQRGVAATVLRPTLVYGVGRDATLTRIAQLAQRWGRFPLPRGANGLRQPVHVRDLATAALSACLAPATHGRSYDLPGGETLPYREMVRRVLACLQPAPPLIELPMPLFRTALAAAQARGIAADLTSAAVLRMREDLVFDLAPAQRDFGYAPRPFRPEARMFVRD